MVCPLAGRGVNRLASNGPRLKTSEAANKKHLVIFSRGATAFNSQWVEGRRGYESLRGCEFMQPMFVVPALAEIVHENFG